MFVVALVPSAFVLFSAAHTAAARLESGRMINEIPGNFDPQKKTARASRRVEGILAISLPISR
jgi:hypothetical protein